MFYKPYNETPNGRIAMINPIHFIKKTEPSALENEIARLLSKLSGLEPDTPEYDKVSDQLKKLYPLKDVDSKRKVSPDALVGAGVNLAGILFVLNFEHAHALTSKALGMVGRKMIG
jgi:hypothetical protein